MNFINKINNFIANYYENESTIDYGAESFYKAMELHDNKDYREALKFYKIALRHEPNSTATYNNMANVYIELEEYDEAIIHYKQALLLDYTDLFSLRNIAYLYRKNAQDKEAITYFEEFLKYKQNDIDVYLDLSYCYINLEKSDKAIETLFEVLKIDSNNIEALREIAVIYLIQHKYESAIEYYLKYLKFELQDDMAWEQLASCYYQIGQYNKCINASKQALLLNREMDGLYLNVFESQLLLDEPFEQELEMEFKFLFKNDKKVFMIYEHLKILESIIQGKEFNLEVWREKYKNMEFQNWEITNLVNWANSQKDLKIKENLLDALNERYFNEN